MVAEFRRAGLATPGLERVKRLAINDMIERYAGLFEQLARCPMWPQPELNLSAAAGPAAGRGYRGHWWRGADCAKVPGGGVTSLARRMR
jgi:hypothetical protein